MNSKLSSFIEGHNCERCGSYFKFKQGQGPSATTKCPACVELCEIDTEQNFLESLKEMTLEERVERLEKLRYEQNGEEY